MLKIKENITTCTFGKGDIIITDSLLVNTEDAIGKLQLDNAKKTHPIGEMLYDGVPVKGDVIVEMLFDNTDSIDALILQLERLKEAMKEREFVE